MASEVGGWSSYVSSYSDPVNDSRCKGDAGSRIFNRDIEADILYKAET